MLLLVTLYFSSPEAPASSITVFRRMSLEVEIGDYFYLLSISNNGIAGCSGIANIPP